MKCKTSMNSLAGTLWIVAEEDAIVSISFHEPNDACMQMTPLLMEAICQLNAYFAKQRTTFTLPLRLEGTSFQKKVWEITAQIPYGHVMTYKEVASLAGRPNAARAVGNAENRNPIVIVVPCHRVIGTNGKLVGYGGGLPIKEALLALEREEFE